MFNIIRKDPFREMAQMHNLMDRMFEDSLAGWPWDFDQPWRGALALDVVEDDNEFVVKASLPGINPNDLEITFSENTLTIKGETKSEKEREQARYHLRERRTGSFYRSITLPSKVKSDKIEASYEAGVLKLRLPKSEEVKPKRIAIKTSQPQVIEAHVKDIKNK